MRAIRGLVLRAMLDPTQLQWQQFWVVECEGMVVACGQLRQFADAQELGSVVVHPAWRGKGLGSFMVHHLISAAAQPLYLECLGGKLARYYERFGFVPVAWRELPPALKWKFGPSALAARFRLPAYFMHYRG
jgi:amino-acid N-acetyltransferase